MAMHCMVQGAGTLRHDILVISLYMKLNFFRPGQVHLKLLWATLPVYKVSSYFTKNR